MTTWTEHRIAKALSAQVFLGKNLIVVPNCNFTGHECDLLVVTPNLRIIDVEIKISRADFKADAAKDKWWKPMIAWSDEAIGPPQKLLWPAKVWKHYFAMPRDIWKSELADYLPSDKCGVILLDERHGMVRAYRHKGLFSGIKGGEDLAIHGTYTDSEAARVRQLKSSGANTGAFGKADGGMPPEIRDKIIAQARANGLDPKVMLQMAAMESGGNANAISSTGAIGVYQFVGKTASGVGISDRFNADQNIAGGMALAKENTKILNDAKLPVSAENLYLVHQLGPTAAIDVIQGARDGKMVNQLSGLTQNGIRLNYGAKSRTAAEYVSAQSTALQNRYAAVVTPTMAPIQAATVQPSTPTKIPSPPDVVSARTPTNTPKRQAINVSIADPIGQNLSDRSLAHVVTGGLGQA